MRPIIPTHALSRAIAFLGASLIASMVGGFLLVEFARQYAAALELAQEEMRATVVVANRNLLPGIAITEDDIYLMEIDKRRLPEGSLTNPELVLGRYPRERILYNEFVRTERLADPESGEGLHAIIPRGMRAISVNLRDGQAVSGMLNPGNYVDVLATLQDDAAAAMATSTVLQAVFVLAVNDRVEGLELMGKEARGMFEPSVTLLVDPRQAEKVAHADQRGRLQLALRNDADHQLASVHGIDADSLRRKLAPPVAQRQVRREVEQVAGEQRQLRIIRGDQVQLVDVAEPRKW